MTTKVEILRRVYELSFQKPQFVAEVSTSGSYARKVRTLIPLGTVSPETVDHLCELIDHLRRMIKIVDDVVDEDEIRDGKSAFWVEHGVEATIEQAAWYLAEARKLAEATGTAGAFEAAVVAMGEAAELEVSLEDPNVSVADPQATWLKIVEKEAAFRRYLAVALGCNDRVVQAMWLDGVAAQILDDSRSALYGKDGRTENSDERLGRLTFMRAFGCSAEVAEKVGEVLKNLVRTILGGEMKNV